MISGSFDDCDKHLPRLVFRKEKRKRRAAMAAVALSLSLSLSVSKFVWFGVFTLMVADYTVSAHTWITE